jgi:hypothetical protein
VADSNPGTPSESELEALKTEAFRAVKVWMEAMQAAGKNLGEIMRELAAGMTAGE